MISQVLDAAFGWKVMLIGIGIAFAVGNLSGGWAGYSIAEAFGLAKTQRAQLENAALVAQGLRDRIEDQKATIADQTNQIARQKAMTTAVNTMAIGVAGAINTLKEAANGYAPNRDDPACRYDDAEFERVRQRIRRATAAGSGLYPAARAGDRQPTTGASGGAQPAGHGR